MLFNLRAPASSSGCDFRLSSFIFRNTEMIATKTFRELSTSKTQYQIHRSKSNTRFLQNDAITFYDSNAQISVCLSKNHGDFPTFILRQIVLQKNFDLVKKQKKNVFLVLKRIHGTAL